MQALLARIGVARDAVVTLGEPCGRERLVSEALRPAAATDLWRHGPPIQRSRRAADAALGTMAMIEAANAEEEALAIAVALREAVEDGKTAALVTPDRALGRRVLAALQRWKIAAEDSGGDALADTPAGIFARLAAEAALDGLAPVTLLALLKHPLLRLCAAPSVPSPRSSARSCAARGRAPAVPASPALADFREQLENFAARSRSICTLRSAHRSRRWRACRRRRSRDAARRGAGAARKPRPRNAYPLSEMAARHREVLAALSRARRRRGRLRRPRRPKACRRAR